MKRTLAAILALAMVLTLLPAAALAAAPSVPAFTPTAGSYTSTQNVTISATGANSIYYSFSAPNVTKDNGTLYTGALNIATTTTIYAIAYSEAAGGGEASDGVGSATFTINPPPAPAKLGTPQGVSFSGTTLNWTAVPNATSYDVALTVPGGAVLPAKNSATNSIVLATDMATAGDYSATVIAKGDPSTHTDRDGMIVV